MSDYEKFINQLRVNFPKKERIKRIKIITKKIYFRIQIINDLLSCQMSVQKLQEQRKILIGIVCELKCIWLKGRQRVKTIAGTR